MNQTKKTWLNRVIGSFISTNLPAPVAWQSISTNVAGTIGLWQFTDPNTGGSRIRFYRSITP